VKTIWLINQYASTPVTGIGGRHFYLARELAKRGHRVYLVAAGWHHLLHDKDGSEGAPAAEDVDGFRLVRIPVPRYGHANDKKRVLNWFLFSWRLWGMRRVISHRPDVIMYSSPAPFGFLGAERLARHFKSRLVFEVRDIWPLTFVDVGGYSPRHPLIKLMQWVEDFAYRKADRVVSNLPGAIDHMVGRGMDAEKFCWVPNGFSLDGQNLAPLPDEITAQVPADKFTIGYAGTHGAANALGVLIEAAELLREYEDIAFVLVGDGPEKNALEALARHKNLTSVNFVAAIPKNLVPNLIVKCDALFISWKKVNIYRYGIAANKLFEYLYSGRPVINCYSGNYDPVRGYGAGITVEAENAKALAQAILTLRAMPDADRRQLGENGKRSALEHHEYGMLARRLEIVLLGSSMGSVPESTRVPS